MATGFGKIFGEGESESDLVPPVDPSDIRSVAAEMLGACGFAGSMRLRPQPVFAAHLDQGGKTRMPFHQCRDMTVFCSANKIALPMTGDGTVLDFCGPFPDGNGIYDLAARVFKDARVPRAANGSQA
jgi:hypothetical protein